MTAPSVCCKNNYEHCRCADSRGALSGLPVAEDSRILALEESPRVVKLHDEDPQPELPVQKPKPFLKSGFLLESKIAKARYSPKDTPPPSAPSSPSSKDSSVSSKRKKTSVKPSTSNESDKVASEAKNDELQNKNPSSEAVPVEEVRDIVELPPPVKCRVCSNDIQPTQEVFYHWTCADQCDFNLHKSCLHDEMSKQGFKKKREFKDAICVTEGCSSPIAAVFEIDMSNKESLYIKSESDKGEKQENKKFDKLKHSLAKDLRKTNKKEAGAKKYKYEKDHGDNGDSGTSSARPSATPEEPSEPEFSQQIPEPKVLLPVEPSISLAMPNSVNGSVVSLVVERKMKPMMVEVNSKAVPLQKKTDEVESKYTVAQQKTGVQKKKQSRQKKEIIDVFTRPVLTAQYGGFDDTPVGFSPLSNLANRVPDSWDDDRSEFSDSRPSSSGHAEPSSFGSARSLPPELSQFPDNINGTATFPLPGTAQSRVYMKNILEAISDCLEDLVANTSDGINAPISGLLDALLVIADNLLEPSQKEFLKKLFTGEDIPSLREFITGLKYFMISMCAEKLTFGKNKAGRELYQCIVGGFADRPSPFEAPRRELPLPPVAPTLSDSIPASLRTNSDVLNQSLDVHVSQEWDDDDVYFDVGEPAYDYQEHHQQQQIFEEEEKEQPFQSTSCVENSSRTTATTPSDSAMLVDQMTNFVLNTDDRSPEQERLFSELDKKIQLKVNALNLKAELQKEKDEELNRRLDEDSWRYEYTNGLVESNTSRHSGFNQQSSNSIYRPGLFSQKHRHVEEPPAPKMVPQEEFNNAIEKHKKELSEMEEKMKEQVKLVKKMERDMADREMVSEQYRKNNELLNGVVNDQEKRLRELEARIRNEKLLRDQEELRVKRLELQHRQLEVEKELFWVESSIYHNKKIIMALMQCSGSEFEDMVEELSENHKHWLTIEEAVRSKKELLQRGVTSNLPELPPVPPLSDRVMHYFQLAVDYSIHPYNELIQQHFPHLKSQLVFYAEIAGQELPNNDSLKEMLLRELQAQEQLDFDIALATRRIASELGLSTYSEIYEYTAPSPPVPVESTRHSPIPPAPTLPAPIARNPRVPASKVPSSSNVNGVWKSTISSSDRNVDLVERDCEICMDPMRANEKIHNCKRCKEPYHSKCVEPWLELQGTCPHCRAVMPHPDLFPELR